MYKTILYTILMLIPINVKGQSEINDSISKRFKEQLSIFPQEKVYLHTDKNVYVAGEKIWFRAYLVNAATHKPTNGSRYVYIELINPIDSLVKRVKIRSTDNLYYGYLPVYNDLPEGTYSIRAYTSYMKNLSYNYFFHKQIRIGNPSYRRIKLENEFNYSTDLKKIYMSFSFYDDNGNKVQPKKILLRYGKKELNPRFSKTNKVFNVHFSPNLQNMPLYIECGDYKTYLDIPTCKTPYMVGFYPEGGQLIFQQPCKIAFKALAKNGYGIPITGYIVDEQEKKICEFTSLHNGMGLFYLTPEKYQYHAICTDTTGQTLRFPLPLAQENAIALQADNKNDSLYIRILSTNNYLPKNLYLVLHTRGQLQYFFQLKAGQKCMAFDKSILPSGISSILLLDKNFHPLSERLIYCSNADQALGNINSTQTDYNLHEKVTTSLSISDASGQLSKGFASMSVTRDEDVMPDSTSSIYAYLLLSSDLQGYIEDANYYFRKTGEYEKQSKALDVLMLTQGWRRYDISKLLQADYNRPQYQIEGSFCITGSVTKGIINKPYSRAIINMMVPQYEYINSIYANEKGHFIFKGFEGPDSTRFILQALSRDGKIEDLNLKVEGDIYPVINPYFSIKPIQSNFQLDNYLKKVEDKYPGIRTIQLDEIIIRGKRTHKSLPTNSNTSFTAQDIEEHRYSDIFEILRKIPGVQISGNNKIKLNRYTNPPRKIIGIDNAISRMIKESGDTEEKSINDKKASNNSTIDCPPLIMIDGTPYEEGFELSQINISDIQTLDIYRGANTIVFGDKGNCGVIAITTKRGYYDPKSNEKRTDIFESDKFLLGYQRPVEFYSPTYLPDQKYYKPDPRTTIYWNPVIKFDGKSSFNIDFYTADKPGTYTFIMEGVTDDGKVFHEEKKINVGKN